MDFHHKHECSDSSITVFLDRDGVINHDSPDYVKSWEEFSFIPGSIDAIRRLNQKGFTVIVITNQSAVGRGIISLEGLNHIHAMMTRQIRAEGAAITDIYFCPHMPDEGCACRKPRPGLILKARDTYGIDLSSAFMVGDNVTDIQCAQNAGCSGILVRTGNGPMAETLLKEMNLPFVHTAENLAGAADWIICRSGYRLTRPQ
jgi:D-glycero-D-manno-heptose 1,7-bisphosphate phosphatase